MKDRLRSAQIESPWPPKGGTLPCAVAGTVVVLLLGLWLNHVGRGDVLGWQLPTGAWTLFYAGRLSVPLFFVVSWKTIDSHWDASLVVGAATLLFGTLSCSAVISSSALLAIPLWAPSLVLCGIGYSLASFSCYVLLARTCGQKTCVIAVAIGFGAKAFFSAALGESDPLLALTFSFVVLGALPLAAFLFSRVSRSAEPIARQPLSTSMRRFLCLLILLASSVLFILTTMSQVGLAGGTSMYSDDSEAGGGVLETTVSLVVYSILAKTVLVNQLESSLTVRYLPSFATLAFGMVLAVASGFAPDDLLGVVVRALLDGIEFFGHLLMWAIVMDVAKVNTPYTARNLAFCAFGEALALTGSVISPNGEPFSATGALIVLMLGFALVTAVTAVLPSLASGRLLIPAHGGGERREDRLATDSPDDSAKDREALSNALSLRCEGIIARCGLTPREREIFLLLCQGRNRNVVAETLGVSLNTVKTHIGHIYAKLGVASHQELLDVLYSGKPESHSVSDN